MKLFLSPNPNPPHNLLIRYPNYEDKALPPGLSDSQILQRAIERAVEVGDIEPDAPIYIVDSEELPEAKYFDAWIWVDGRVLISAAKRRELYP